MEIGRAHGIEGGILERLAAYSQLAPDVVACLGGRDWPPVPLVVVQAQCCAEGRQP